jgi:hypothetical protein
MTLATGCGPRLLLRLDAGEGRSARGVNGADLSELCHLRPSSQTTADSHRVKVSHRLGACTFAVAMRGRHGNRGASVQPSGGTGHLRLRQLTSRPVAW